MTAIAQGTSKQVNVVKQSALGTLGSTGSQTIRRKTGVGKADRDVYKSDEIVAHHQSTGVSYGVKKVDYKLDGDLSSGTYQVFIAGMLEAAFGTAATITGTGIAATVGTFTDSGNGFLTAGFKVGDVVRATGFTGASTNSNSRNYWVTAVTAGVMTGSFLDGSTQVADAAGESVTITVVGKKCKPPLTSHTKDYFTIEDWYSDLTDSDLFGDMVVASMDFDLPATGNASIGISLVGCSRTASGTQVLTSPSSETTTGIMAAINGRLNVQSASTLITGLKISITNAAVGTGAEVGTNVSGDVSRDVIQVSGSFTANLRDQVITALYEAETPVSIASVLTADETATSHFMAFTMGKVKITGDAPNDGKSNIFRTYPFTAEINRSGGAALAWDDTILSIQDSAAT